MLKTYGDLATATQNQYKGEEIIVNITIKGGQKYYDKEYVPRRVWHNTQGKPAFVIGNGQTREQFDLERLRGKGTTYGCNAVYRDFDPDYIVSLDRIISEEIAKASCNRFQIRFIIGHIIIIWEYTLRSHIS